MPAPRHLVLLGSAALSLAAAAIALWSGSEPERASDPPAPPVAAEAETARGEAALQSAGNLEARPPRESAVLPAREDPPAPPDPAASYEKRYRGFAPEQLELAHEKLCESLLERAEAALREKFRKGEARDLGPTEPEPLDDGTWGDARSDSSVEEEGTYEVYLSGARSPLGPRRAVMILRGLRPDGTLETRIAEVDVGEDASTREIAGEIAWLASKLPARGGAR